MGCARDIVEYAGVPRLLFSDFPLGNAAGRPHDPASQAFTLELALRVLESAPAARTTVQVGDLLHQRGVEVTSLLTTGDSVNAGPGGAPYRLVGVPDGLGAFDNSDGTFTLLVAHELDGSVGVARAGWMSQSAIA